MERTNNGHCGQAVQHRTAEGREGGKAERANGSREGRIATRTTIEPADSDILDYSDNNVSEPAPAFSAAPLMGRHSARNSRCRRRFGAGNGEWQMDRSPRARKGQVFGTGSPSSPAMLMLMLMSAMGPKLCHQRDGWTAEAPWPLLPSLCSDTADFSRAVSLSSPPFCRSRPAITAVAIRSSEVRQKYASDKLKGNERSSYMAAALVPPGAGAVRQLNAHCPSLTHHRRPLVAATFKQLAKGNGTLVARLPV